VKPRVLIVDNDPERAGSLSEALAPGYECSRARSLDEAFAVIGRAPWDVTLTNYDLGPRQSGIELLQAIRECVPRALRVLYCRQYCDGLAHDAARLAAAHAIVDARRPDFPVTVHQTLDRLLLSPGLVPAPAPGEGHTEPEWFAHSAASKVFLATLSDAALSERPVFLFGEHGSGRSLAATLFRRWRSRWRDQAALEGPRATSRASGPAAVLTIPPLRERREDIPALVQHCLERHARQNGEPVRHLTNAALDELMGRPWWGNVHELQGVLIRACQRAGARLGISEADLPHDAEPPLQPSQLAKDAGQRECVLRQLRAAGNVSGAARLEGISRTNYIRLMRRLGVMRADTAPAGEPAPAESGA
jgi:DNA-binding NtrC family response regulator